MSRVLAAHAMGIGPGIATGMGPVLRAGIVLAIALVGAGSAWSAGPKLYDTGPAQDAAFIRFVNASEQGIDVIPTAKGSKGGKLRVEPAKPATEFMAVRPKSAMTGRIVQGSTALEVAPVAQPGELVSVVVWPNGGAGLATETVAELPKDFNGLKASLAFYNFDAACNMAGLSAAGRDAVIFDTAPLKTVQRRAVNPVALAVQATCGKQPVGKPQDLGTLEAGQRYSVFLVGGAQGSHRVFWVKDVLAP